MGDEHLDIISETKSDKFIKYSVKNLVPNPSEFEDDSECDVPACNDFTTFFNLLFDADDDLFSSDDESFSDEDISKEIYSNPLFDEEIIFIKIDPHHFNIDSDLIESLLNQDSLIFLLLRRLILFFMSSPVNSFFSNQFHQELMNSTVILRKKFVLSRNYCMITHLLVPRKNLFLKILMLQSNLSLHLLSPLRIVTLLWIRSIYLLLRMPPGIENDDYDSDGDILILEDLLINYSLSLLKNESFHFDIPSSPRPPAKPPDDDEIEPTLGIWTDKVVDDISIPMPRLLPNQPTLASNQDKSPHFLSHRGLKAF
nr:hypothetical protein [Tanacetum cinerariifolium]